MEANLNFAQIYREMKQNQWMHAFTVFCRVALAAGFLPSGFVKIMGERFTDLAINHPMGHYLEALHYTGYYYTFIGIAQMLAAILLLIPRTATLGALLYFPIILNICILSFAVCFDGSLLTSPLMVLANVYLLCWDYDRLKFILPMSVSAIVPKPKITDRQFPIVFFTIVLFTVIATLTLIVTTHTFRPRNTLSECQTQCADSENPEACEKFCRDIHTDGMPYPKALNAYHTAIQNNKSN